MPLFKMGREAPATPATPAAPSHLAEKPLPVPRPGTSGTEALLVTNRRRASENYQKAHRAEKAYRAKKRASAARRDFKSAKDHYRESLQHLKQGLKMTLAVVRATPYIVGEKRHQRQLRADEKRKKKALEKKKELEERLAKESLEAEEVDGEKMEGEEAGGSK